MSDFRKIEEELAEAFDAGGFEVMRKGGDVFICALPFRCDVPEKGCTARRFISAAEGIARLECADCLDDMEVGLPEIFSLTALAKRIAGA